MTLLDFARGPGMYISITILVFGVLWQLAGAFLLTRRQQLATPRIARIRGGPLRAIVSRSAPAPELEKKVRFQHISGYIWHIGLFMTVFFFAPHVAFFKDILGFGWPTLPNAVILWTAVITLTVLITLTLRRIFHPVLRMISTTDDYISLLVMLLPLITGLMSYAHIGPRYQTMLGLHLLSVQAMFVWIPFSKLMHMILWIPGRYRVGRYFGRKGVRA